MLAGFALTGIFRLFCRREFDTPRTTLLLSALWIALLLAAAALRFPVSALMVLPALLLVWIGIESTGEPGKRVARWTAGFLLVTTLLLAIRIHAAAGTRDGRHGPTLSCQWEVVQAIRSGYVDLTWTEDGLQVVQLITDDHTAVRLYLDGTVPQCAELSVDDTLCLRCTMENWNLEQGSMNDESQDQNLGRDQSQ